MIGKIGLLQKLADREPVEIQDVIRTKRALEEVGFYDRFKEPIDGHARSYLFERIKAYQTARALTVDGVMTPGGETEHDLEKVREIEKSPTFRCLNCGAFHGGVYSSTICFQCWGKGLR